MPAAPLIRFFHETPVRITGAGRIKRFLTGIFKSENQEVKSLNYIFCSDAYLLKINKQYLKHDDYTDIITFNLGDKNQVQGEIYISIDRVRANAKKLDLSLRSELLRVMIHGVLHLCGYSDKTASERKNMRNLEDHYMAKV